MTDIAKKKANFRGSKVWTEFRKYKREHDCVDYVTRKKLTPSYNLHHMDLDPDHYQDISNPDNFACLNSKTHDLVHHLYLYYRKDPDVINRLRDVLERMVEINERGEL